MIKLFFMGLFFIALDAFAANPCTLKRLLHVEISGSELPLELRNKILNQLDPDKIYLIKENQELAIKICAGFIPFKEKSEILTIVENSKVEHLLVKVDFTKQNLFWLVKIESFIKSGNKGLVLLRTLDSLKSPKPISDLKNVEVADWIMAKLFEISKK